MDANKQTQKSLKSTRGHVTTWQNLPGEVSEGWCATLSTEKLGVHGRLQRHDALNDLASKLEAIAAELRAEAKKAFREATRTQKTSK